MRLPKEGLRLFWKELVVHAMLPHDSDMFYVWLKEICDAHLQGESIVDVD